MASGCHRFFSILMIVAFGSPLSVYARKAENVRVGQSHFYVIQENNRQGGLAKQVITGSDYSEIHLDLTGDGTLDHYEVSKGDINVVASHPYKGHFTKLEVERRLKKGAAHLEFVLSEDRKRYRLLSSQYRPYKTMKKEDIIVGDICRDSDSQIYDFSSAWRSILEKMAKYSSEERENKILCQIQKFQEFIFDDSCTGPNSKFKNDLPKMQQALAKVLASSFVNKGTSPRYLACMQENKLPNHAARIEAKLYGRIVDSQNAKYGIDGRINRIEKMLPELIAAKKADANDILALKAAAEKIEKEIEDESSCDTIHIPSVLQKAYGSSLTGPSIVPFQQSHQKLIRCQASNEPRKCADYNADRDQITIANANCIVPLSDVFFHELVHSSRIEDEFLTDSIELCCGTDSNESACSALRHRLAKYETTQTYSAIFSEKAGYELLLDDLDKAFGINTKDVLDGYLLDLEENAKRNSAKYSQCTLNEGKVCDDKCRAACDSALIDLVESNTKAYFDKNCSRLQALSREGRGVNCDTITNRFKAVVRNFCPTNSISGFQFGPRYIDTLLSFVFSEAQAQGQGFGINSGIRPSHQAMISGAPAVQSSSSKPSCTDPILREPSTIADGRNQTPVVDNSPSPVQDAVRDTVNHENVSGNIGQRHTVPPSSTVDQISAPANNRGSENTDLSAGQNPGYSNHGMSGIRLGEQNSARRDIASHTRRGSAVVDTAERAVRDILPVAQARLLEFEPSRLSGRKVSIDNPFNNPSFVIPKLAANNVGSPDRTPSSSQPASQVQQVQTADGSGMGSDALGVKDGIVNTPSRGKAKAGKKGVAQAKGRSGGGSAGKPVARSTASKGSKPPQAAEFKNIRELREFLTGPYNQVYPRFSQAAFKRMLIDFRTQVKDHQGTVHGSRAPKMTLEYCAPKKGLIDLAGGECSP